MVKTRHGGGDFDEDLNENAEHTTLNNVKPAHKNDYSRTKDSVTNVSNSLISSSSTDPRQL